MTKGRVHGLNAKWASVLASCETIYYIQQERPKATIRERCIIERGREGQTVGFQKRCVGRRSDRADGRSAVAEPNRKPTLREAHQGL